MEIKDKAQKQLIDAGFIRGTSYEVFVLAISVLSLINLILLLLPFGGDSNQVVFIVDKFIGVLFIYDFILNIVSSKDKKKYFFKNFGWADLLAAIPFSTFNIFRIFRIIRLLNAVHLLGLHKVRKLIRATIADTALYIIFFIIILLLEFGSIAILAVERDAANANIKNASDALWWAFVSITTVGYGDKYPVTNGGRLIGVLTLTVGVGMFGILTGYLANIFVRNNKK